MVAVEPLSKRHPRHDSRGPRPLYGRAKPSSISTWPKSRSPTCSAATTRPANLRGPDQSGSTDHGQAVFNEPSFCASGASGLGRAPGTLLGRVDAGQPDRHAERPAGPRVRVNNDRVAVDYADDISRDGLGSRRRGDEPEMSRAVIRRPAPREAPSRTANLVRVAGCMPCRQRHQGHLRSAHPR